MRAAESSLPPVPCFPPPPPMHQPPQTGSRARTPGRLQQAPPHGPWGPIRPYPGGPRLRLPAPAGRRAGRYGERRGRRWQAVLASFTGHLQLPASLLPCLAQRRPVQHRLTG